MRILKVLGAAALLAGVSTVALAADLPSRKAPEPVYVEPVFSWTGFYIGANLGGVIAETRGTPTSLFPPAFAVFAPGLPSPTSSKFGFIGGGQVGFNYQMGSLVMGLEADFDATTASDTQNIVLPTLVGPVAATAQTKLDWLATVRARFGYTISPRLLAYLTGGLAIGGGSTSASAVFLPAPIFNWAGTTSSTSVGWTIGAGAEYALTSNFSVKAEYLYYDLGKSQLTLASVFPVVSAATYDVKRDGHVFRVGLNYRFGGGSGPVVAKY